MNSTGESSSEKTEPSPILEAALGYHALGFSVIPVHGIVDGQCTCGKPDCPSMGKHPALKSWKPYQNTRATEAQIREWLTGRSHHNVGIVTGKVSGIVVLDVDGEEGHRALAEAGYEIAPTAHAHTGGGGDHYYFRYPEEGLGNSASRVATSVDVRGDGGFVVVPPSIHRSGGAYQWVAAPGDSELAEMPAWMIVTKTTPITKAPSPIKRTATLQKSSGSTGIEMSRRQQESMVRAWTERVRLAPEGERNDTFNRAIFDLASYQGLGMDPELVRQELGRAAREAGLGDPEIESTFRSAWTAGGAAGGTPAIFDPQAIESLNDLFSRVSELAALGRDEYAAARQALKGRFGAALDLKDLQREVVRYRQAHPGFAHRLPSRSSAPYLEDEVGIVWLKDTREGPQPTILTNFRARITADITEDDGAERRRIYEIETDFGRGMRSFHVLAASFGGMNWVGENLGAKAIIYPGFTNREHARTAIQLLSGEVPERHIYTHTGWRELPDGTRVFLHGDGALGADGPVEGVEVRLPDELARYRLPSEVDDPVAAVRASLRILELVPDIIGIPLLGTVFRAPCENCDFSLFLAGPTGVGKSELAALAQQHFGAEMDRIHLPGTYASTANSLEGTAFVAKDVVFVADDFAPTGTIYEVSKQHQQADRLLRGQGNRQGRQRMRPDGTLRPAKPPRGLIVSTGEDVPRGQSLRARILVVEMGPGSLDFQKLTAAQKDAREGLYAQCMSAYIQHLAELQPVNHKAEIVRLRDQAALADAHRRTIDIVANLAYGMHTFLGFAESVGALGEKDREEFWERSWSVLLEVGRAQVAQQAASEPVQRFLELLSSALSSGVAHVATAEGHAPTCPGAWGWRMNDDDFSPQGKRVGWLDGDYLYLDSDAALVAAQEIGRNLGDSLTITPRTLRKRLSEKRLLQSEGTVRQTYTVRRRLEGRERNVIHLLASVLSGVPEPDKTDKAAERLETTEAIEPEGQGAANEPGMEEEDDGRGHDNWIWDDPPKPVRTTPERRRPDRRKG